MKKQPGSISRRGFLKKSAAAAVAAGMARWTAKSYSQIIGSNEDIRIAVIGANDCGRAHIKTIRSLPGVRLIALCDVDSAVLDQDMKTIANLPATQPAVDQIERYSDFRKLLDRTDLDAITTATPDHWHALITLLACQAGKDVYVEKPTCHNIWEGRQALAASRKYNRIVQAGTQWRSMPQVVEAMQWIKAGNLGKILVSRGFCYKRRPSIGKTTGPQPIPSTVDYDLWCGPAPADPPRRTRFHYDWHWFWQTGNGDIANQGAHNMDLARLALGKTTVAPTVLSVGGRFGYVDDGQTPNTMMAVHDYGDALLIFEVRGLPAKAGAGNQMDQYKGAEVGNVIECEGGYVTLTEHAWGAFDSNNKLIHQFKDPGNMTREQRHMTSFLTAMRTRRREDQSGELADGHISSSMSHLSNISYRIGNLADPDEIQFAVKSSPAAQDTFDRLQKHLSANNIAIDTDKLQLGMPLKVNPADQTIIGNDAASALLTRQYRAPFVVPQIEAS